MGKRQGRGDHVDAQLRYRTCEGHKGLADQVLLERDGDGWKCVGFTTLTTPLLYFDECKTPE
jgi:hypothetical protein